MFTDNIIYILQLKDECRVAEMGAPDNLYWSYVEGDPSLRMIPIRLVSVFLGKNSFSDYDTAMRYAKEIYDEIEYVEYGIATIDMRGYSWNDLLNMAYPIAVKEMDYIMNADWKGKEDWYLDAMNDLESIVDALIQ
jgi:hypothetical protein